jgi:hypothetical protein
MATTLQITVADPKPVYTAGDTIKGQVILFSPRDEAIGKVAICFTGRGKTKLTRSRGNSRAVYRGRAPLFRQVLVLYQNHYTHKAGQYAWDFQFTVPARTDPTLTEGTWKGDGAVWLRTGVAHELPPTFQYYHNGSRNQGMVEYKLEAEMLRHNPSIFNSKVEAERNITYTPPPPPGGLEFRLFLREEQYEARTLLLLPERAQGSLTVMEKFHSLFNRAMLPSATFKIRLIYPTYSYPGCRIPLKLAIVHMETSAGIPTPAVTLTSLSIKITSQYGFRSQGFTAVNGHVVREYALLNLPNVTPVVVPQNPGTSAQPAASSYCTACYDGMPDGDTYLDLSSWRADQLATPLVCPSFRTMNVAVAHALWVKLRLSCAGKDFTFNHAQDLQVRSPPRGGVPRAGAAGAATGAPASAAAGAARGAASPLDGDVLLPTYSPTVERGAQRLEGGVGPPAYVGQ